MRRKRTKKKRVSKPAMRAWTIVGDAVERGIAFGLNGVRKHADRLDDVSDDVIVGRIHDEVMNALSGVIDWDELK